MTEETNGVGEIHILIRPGENGTKDEIEISTSYNITQLNWVVDQVKKMIVEGELKHGID